MLGNIGTPSQKKKIENLVQEDKFLLIIFDACRYDYFQSSYTDHYNGELEKVYTTNTYTMQYLFNTWTSHYNITYVSGGPVISDENFEINNMGYRPSKHFDRIIPAWDMGYKKELGVTPPEAVTKSALENPSEKMVVHYFQPHAPYIGERKLREKVPELKKDQESIDDDLTDSLKDIYNKMELGEISEDNLKSAYSDNLERVLKAAKPLVQNSNKRTVITSDHGELLGESGRYMHGGMPHEILSDLPWLEVSNVKGDLPEVSPERAKQHKDQKQVEDQLRDLGYL
jgi:hypothetical protein